MDEERLSRLHRRHDHPRLRRRHHLNKAIDDDDDDDNEDKNDRGNEKEGESVHEGYDEDESAKSTSTSLISSSSSPRTASTASSRLLVANAVSPLDGAVVGLVTDKLRPLNTTKLNPLLSWVFGYRSAITASATRRGGGGGTPPSPLDLTVEEEVAAGMNAVLVFPE